MSCRRHRAVSLLLGYEPALLDYLFTPARTRLRRGARTLRHEAQLLGPVRHLLVKLALDIWNGKGAARLPDICRLLPAHHYDCFIVAMEYLGATAALGCGCPRCRTLGANAAIDGGQTNVNTAARVRTAANNEGRSTCRSHHHRSTSCPRMITNASNP